MQIYHNPRCSKSRQTLALLQERGAEPEIIRYLDTPPSATELKNILAKLGLTPHELMRRGEPEYKALDLANHPLSDAQLINAMIEHPKLIERPIVVAGDKACLGRPPENVLEL